MSQLFRKPTQRRDSLLAFRQVKELRVHGSFNNNSRRYTELGTSSTGEVSFALGQGFGRSHDEDEDDEKKSAPTDSIGMARLRFKSKQKKQAIAEEPEESAMLQKVTPSTRTSTPATRSSTATPGQLAFSDLSVETPSDAQGAESPAPSGELEIVRPSTTTPIGKRPMRAWRFWADRCASPGAYASSDSGLSPSPHSRSKYSSHHSQSVSSTKTSVDAVKLKREKPQLMERWREVLKDPVLTNQREISAIAKAVGLREHEWDSINDTTPQHLMRRLFALKVKAEKAATSLVRQRRMQQFRRAMVLRKIEHRNAARMIQRAWAWHRFRHRCRVHALARRVRWRLIVKIQRGIREWRARKESKRKEAVNQIDLLLSGFAELQLQNKIAAAREIIRAWRSCKFRRVVFAFHRKHVQAITLVQRMWRLYSAKKKEAARQKKLQLEKVKKAYGVGQVKGLDFSRQKGKQKEEGEAKPKDPTKNLSRMTLAAPGANPLPPAKTSPSSESPEPPASGPAGTAGGQQSISLTTIRSPSIADSRRGSSVEDPTTGRSADSIEFKFSPLPCTTSSKSPRKASCMGGWSVLDTGDKEQDNFRRASRLILSAIDAADAKADTVRQGSIKKLNRLSGGTQSGESSSNLERIPQLSGCLDLNGIMGNCRKSMENLIEEGSELAEYLEWLDQYENSMEARDDMRMNGIPPVFIYGDWLDPQSLKKRLVAEQMLLQQAGGWHPAMEMGEFEVCDLDGDDEDSDEEDSTTASSKSSTKDDIDGFAIGGIVSTTGSQGKKPRDSYFKSIMKNSGPVGGGERMEGTLELTLQLGRFGTKDESAIAKTNSSIELQRRRFLREKERPEHEMIGGGSTSLADGESFRPGQNIGAKASTNLLSAGSFRKVNSSDEKRTSMLPGAPGGNTLSMPGGIPPPDKRMSMLPGMSMFSAGGGGIGGHPSSGLAVKDQRRVSILPDGLAGGGEGTHSGTLRSQRGSILPGGGLPMGGATGRNNAGNLGGQRGSVLPGQGLFATNPMQMGVGGLGAPTHSGLGHRGSMLPTSVQESALAVQELASRAAMLSHSRKPMRNSKHEIGVDSEGLGESQDDVAPLGMGNTNSGSRGLRRFQATGLMGAPQKKRGTLLDKSLSGANHNEQKMNALISGRKGMGPQRTTVGQGRHQRGTLLGETSALGNRSPSKQYAPGLGTLGEVAETESPTGSWSILDGFGDDDFGMNSSGFAPHVQKQSPRGQTLGRQFQGHGHRFSQLGLDNSHMPPSRISGGNVRGSLIPAARVSGGPLSGFGSPGMPPSRISGGNIRGSVIPGQMSSAFPLSGPRGSVMPMPSPPGGRASNGPGRASLIPSRISLNSDNIHDPGYGHGTKRSSILPGHFADHIDDHGYSHGAKRASVLPGHFTDHIHGHGAKRPSVMPGMTPFGKQSSDERDGHGAKRPSVMPGMTPFGKQSSGERLGDGHGAKRPSVMPGMTPFGKQSSGLGDGHGAKRPSVMPGMTPFGKQSSGEREPQVNFGKQLSVLEEDKPKTMFGKQLSSSRQTLGVPLLNPAAAALAGQLNSIEDTEGEASVATSSRLSPRGSMMAGQGSMTASRGSMMAPRRSALHNMPNMGRGSMMAPDSHGGPLAFMKVKSGSGLDSSGPMNKSIRGSFNAGESSKELGISGDIQVMCSKVALFQLLPAEIKHKMESAIEMRVFKKDDVILDQGNSGREFHLIDDGAVVLYHHDPVEDKSTRVGRLEKGSFFGEAGLIAPHPSHVKIKAAGQGCSTLCITHASFEDRGLRKALAASCLQKIPMLRAFRSEDCENLARLLNPRHWDRHQEVGTGLVLAYVPEMMILMEGTLLIYSIEMHEGEPVSEMLERDPLATLKPGCCIGESIVLQGEDLQVRIVAGPGGATTLGLTQDAFTQSGFREKLLERCIAQVPLFKQLPAVQISEYLAAMEMKQWDSEEPIIMEGQQGHDLFIIIQGMAVMEGEFCPQPVTIEPGAFFGEKALLCGEVWKASVYAQRGGATTLSLPGGLFRGLNLQKRLCEQVFGTVPLFQSLEQDDLNMVTEAATTDKFGPGEAIVTQGEKGEDFFIIQSGTAIVEASINAGPPSEVAQLAAGEYFGEKALLTGEVRRATVRAASEGCVTLSINSKTFHSCGLNLRITEFWISNVPIFSSMTRAQRQAVAESMVSRSVPPGAIVIAQGELGTEFFIIQGGRCQVYVEDHTTKVESLKCTLEAGDFFGEKALVSGDRRLATVIADPNEAAPASLLVLDSVHFQKLGLKRHLAKYMLDEGTILEEDEDEDHDADSDEEDGDDENYPSITVSKRNSYW